jgi:uncharacterized peroxidase-related enzyme
MSTRVNYYQLNKPAMDALGAVSKQFGSIDPKLRALVELRVSQINGCVYCVDMHSTQAREHGETQQRLDCVCVWHEAPFFDEKERAAFAWAESLTNISQTHAPDDVYAQVAAHFDEKQIVDLTLIISMMNMWNRVAISHRKMPGKR